MTPPGGGRPDEGPVEHPLPLQIAAVLQRALDLGRAVQVREGPAHHPAGPGRLSPPLQHRGVLQGAHRLKPRVLPPQAGSGQPDGLDDLHVARAAAVVVLQGRGDLLLRGVGAPVQQGLGRQHHPRRAESALHRPHVQKGLLDGVQPAVGAPQPLNGEDPPPRGAAEPGHAGADGLVVQQHGARAAVARAAAVLGPPQAGRPPQILEQGLPRLAPAGDRLPVERKFNAFLFHMRPPPVVFPPLRPSPAVGGKAVRLIPPPLYQLFPLPRPVYYAQSLPRFSVHINRKGRPAGGPSARFYFFGLQTETISKYQ